MERRSFLKALGGLIGAASAAPVLARGANPAPLIEHKAAHGLLAPSGEALKPSTEYTVDELLAKDYLFNRAVYVKSVQLTSNRNVFADYHRQFDRRILDEPLLSPEYNMDVEAYIEDNRLLQLAHRAMHSAEPCTIDLKVLRDTGLDQSRLHWYLRGITVNHQYDALVTARMQFFSRGTVAFIAPATADY